MTFLEAAMALLKQTRKPLHFKKLAELAARQGLLDHVGRTPEVAMQTALANAIKKGQPDLLVRVQPGVFALRYYPPATAGTLAEAEAEQEDAKADETAPSESPKRPSRRGARRTRPAIERPQVPEALSPSTSVGGQVQEAQEEQDTHPVRAPRPLEAANGSNADARALPGGDEEEEDVPPGEESATAFRSVDSNLDRTASGALSPDGQRRRRRRRRRGRGQGAAFEGAPQAHGQGHPHPQTHGHRPSPEGRPNLPPRPPVSHGRAEPPRPASSGPGNLADRAYEVLRMLDGGRPAHVRQIADMAIKRKLITDTGPDIWRAVRAALQQDIRRSLALGLRPRIRFTGGAQFQVADRRVESDLITLERNLAQQAEGVRAQTRAYLARRLASSSAAGFETLARLLLERMGFGSFEGVKRTSEALYLGCTRPRGVGQARTLISIRPGPEAGRRAVGELRAGVSARGFLDGFLVAAGALHPDALAEAATAGPPVELMGGSQVAEGLVKEGIGVVRAALPIEYLDADFFSDLEET